VTNSGNSAQLSGLLTCWQVKGEIDVSREKERRGAFVNDERPGSDCCQCNVHPDETRKGYYCSRWDVDQQLQIDMYKHLIAFPAVVGHGSMHVVRAGGDGDLSRPHSLSVSGGRT
jgi:hypothetical protein